MMKTICLLACVVSLICGCSKQPQKEQPPSTRPALPAGLDSYFQQYCDYTGSLGIGFVAWHTYDYRFRQHLKKTDDPELKRLYVLYEMHQELDWAIQDFEQGIIKTGKTESRPLTPDEWETTRQRLVGQITHLETYAAFTNYATGAMDMFDRHNPDLDQQWVEEKRKQVEAVKAPEK